MGFWGWFKSRALIMIENFVAFGLLFVGLIYGFGASIRNDTLSSIISLGITFLGIIILAYNYYRIRHRGYLEKTT